MSNTSPLRLGILGCANIARQFVRDAQASERVDIVAVASRQLEKSQAFAQEFGLAQAYGRYEDLLCDANIDAVYIPLPNHLHAEWAIKAAQAGKHVLCEKPLTLSVKDAQAIFAAAQQHGVTVLEAYPYYFQPQTQTLLNLLRQGEIGQVKSVVASFGFMLAQGTDNIRWKPEAGGGAILDAGSYALSLIRLVMGQAPQKVMADARWTDTGVDVGASVLLHFADNRQAVLSCAMDTANHRRATIAGDKGTIETEYLNHTADSGATHPYGYLPSDLRIRRGTANTILFEDIAAPTGSGFLFAADAFAQMLQAADAQAISEATQASLDIAATLEAILQSTRSGAWVDVVTV